MNIELKNKNAFGFAKHLIKKCLVLFLCLLMSGYSSAELYFVHTDQLGTPQTMTDQNKVVVWQAQRSPFGEMATAPALNIGFPGQYFDAESDLSYNYFRDYDASLGRYVESDPIGLGGGINTYSYVLGNPVRLIDPTGLAAADEPFDAPATVILGLCVLTRCWGHSNGSADNWSGSSGGSSSSSGASSGSSDDSGKNCPPNDKDPCKGLRDQLAAHEQKLAEYMKDPYGHDNKGFLGQGRDEQIIAARIRSLQGQIENFRKLLAECEAKNGH